MASTITKKCANPHDISTRAVIVTKGHVKFLTYAGTPTQASGKGTIHTKKFYEKHNNNTMLK